MRLEVPLIPPSGNELRRKYRTVFAYRDLRRVWEKALYLAPGAAWLNAEFRRQCRSRQKLLVTIYIHRPKALDCDNLMAGLKPVFDALKSNIFIWDDSPEHIEVPMPKQLVSRKRKTVIEITPCPTE